MFGGLLKGLFKVPGLGKLFIGLGEGLLRSVLKGLAGKGTYKALREVGKKVGQSIADALPDDLEDLGAAFLAGVSEGLEKAN